MMRKLCVLALILCLMPFGVCAEQAAQQSASLQTQIDDVIGGLDFSGLDALHVPGFDQALSVEALVRALSSGKTLSPEDSVSRVLSLFFDALSGFGALMLAIMLPVILSSLLLHTIASGRSGLVSLSKSVCSVLILIPVMLLVFSQLDHTRETITVMTQRMDKLLPMLLTLLTALGGSASSAFLHPMVVAASGSM
ncbi:MAG: hypothetical protein IJ337_06040, partial [Clostridia bacterium]|nr:hypothetical protein [Clostridia bacterium]